MDNKISFKLVAEIAQPYRDWFDTIIKGNPCKVCDECIEHTYTVTTKNGTEELVFHKAACEMVYSVKLLWGNGIVENVYDKDTGLLITGFSALETKHYIEYVIKNAILPYSSKIHEYYSINDIDFEYPNQEEEPANYACMLNIIKDDYIKKNMKTIKKLNQTQTPNIHDNPLHDKMKEFLIKDVEVMLDRYTAYNFDLTELRACLQKL